MSCYVRVRRVIRYAPTVKSVKNAGSELGQDANFEDFSGVQKSVL